MSKRLFSASSEQCDQEGIGEDRRVIDSMRMLSPSEVAEIIRVPEATLAVWRCNRTGPRYSKLGKHARYRVEDVARYIEERRWGGTFAEEGEAA